ncbi:unnamed protein product, partial [Ascophyllum nodosum]
YSGRFRSTSFSRRTADINDINRTKLEVGADARFGDGDIEQQREPRA